MKIKSLSNSAIEMFEQCPWKFMRVYDGGEEGKIPRGYAPSSVEGSLVHKVLEEWHRDRTKNMRDLLKQAVKETKKEWRPDEREFEIMEYKQFHGAFQLLQDYAKRNDIYPKVIQTEFGFDFVLPNGVPVRGRIDRIDQIGSDTVRLVDYKTTRVFIYRDDVRTKLQGLIYTMVARNFLFPDVKHIIFCVDALRFKPIEVEYTEDELNAAADYLELKYNEILAMNPQEAKPRLNKFCGYCHLIDSCPLMQNALNGGTLDDAQIPDIEGNKIVSSPEELVTRIVQLDESITETTNYMSKLRKTWVNALDEMMDAQGISFVETPSHTAQWVQTRYRNSQLEIKPKEGTTNDRKR